MSVMQRWWRQTCEWSSLLWRKSWDMHQQHLGDGLWRWLGFYRCSSGVPSAWSPRIWSAFNTTSHWIISNTYFTTLSTGALAYDNAYFKSGTGPIYLSNVMCSGNEASLLSCASLPIGSQNCEHSKDAGVSCQIGTINFQSIVQVIHKVYNGCKLQTFQVKYTVIFVMLFVSYHHWRDRLESLLVLWLIIPMGWESLLPRPFFLVYVSLVKGIKGIEHG